MELPAYAMHAGAPDTTCPGNLTMTERNATDRKKAQKPQPHLDSVVVTIELTLISIVQGVALHFLAIHSSDVLVGLQFTLWPYVVTGLVIIFLFWSRSVLHTLTVIRWPLDFGHNFMYIACALVETITFTQLTHPLHWYALNALFGLMTWLLFILDLRMVRRRINERAGPPAGRLYEIVEREQLLNIKFLMPSTVVFNLLAMIAVIVWPAPLIRDGGHVIIALVQLAAASGYLLYVMRFFARIVPLIEKTRQEWCEE